jgi:tight adherence protein C
VIALACLFVAVGCGIVGGGLFASRRTVAEAANVAVMYDDPAPIRAGLVHRALEPLLDQAARLMRALSPAARLDLIGRRIIYAGLEGKFTVENVLVRKALAAGAGGMLGMLAHPHRVPGVVAAVLGAAIASFVPDVLLDSRARSRQKEIARGLPDALDLLAITVEAGLGLEQALGVVTDRLTGPLGDELRRMLAEIELGVDRRHALDLLRRRTDVRELSAFVVALHQADELGIAVGDVLRVQAHQVRLIRRQRAREAAAKTPVKILFPVVLGVFPAMFVVAVGPGAITIIRTLFTH